MPRVGVTNCIICNYIRLSRTVTGEGLFLQTTEQNTKKLPLVRYELSVKERQTFLTFLINICTLS